MVTKRRRLGGSKGRHAAIANRPIVHHPSLQRKIPIMEVTNREGALTVGYGKTMIDFEQLGAFYHFLQGPKFDDIEEVFQLAKKVGPGEHFLGENHTLESNLFIFDSQHNNSFEQWEADGELESEQVGVNKAKKWLQQYQVPPMDEALLAYIAKRESEIPLTAG